MVRAPSPPVVKAERGALPVYPLVPSIFGVERAVAVTQAADEGAPSFLAQNVAVRLSPLAARLFDEGSHTLRDAAKEVMAGIDNLAR